MEVHFQLYSRHEAGTMFTGDRRKCSPAPDGVKLGVKIEVTPGNWWKLLVSGPLPFITWRGGSSTVITRGAQ